VPGKKQRFIAFKPDRDIPIGIESKFCLKVVAIKIYTLFDTVSVESNG
jgi:hypothetical protein